MEKLTTKLIAIILALTAICGSVVIPVGAASTDDTVITQLFEYKESESGNIIITRVEAPDEDVIIPSEIEGKTVTEFLGRIIAKSVTFPETMTSIQGGIYTEEIIVDENNTNYCSVDGVLYSKDMKTLKLYPSNKEASFYIIPDSVECVEFDAFLALGKYASYSGYEEYYLKKVILGKNVKEYSCVYSAFEEFEVHPENEYFCSVDGVLFTNNKEVLWRYPSLRTENIYSIPEGTLTIDGNAFFHCFNTDELIIPETLCQIGFYYDDSDPVENFGFAYCMFNNIEVVENNNCFCSVDGVLFTKDMKQLIKYNSGNERSSYTIPEGVETINRGSFIASFYLKSLGIPKSLKCVEENAFPYGVADGVNVKLNGLVNIAYSGSEEEWENITIEENNEPFELANLVTNAKVEEKSNITVVYSSNNFNVDDEELANYSVRVTELDVEFSDELISGIYAGAKFEVFGYYDIEIVDGTGSAVQIEDGEVFVTMPVPENLDINSKFVVYHVKDDGTRVAYSLNPKNEYEKQLKIEFGHFVFSVDSFSKFEFYQVIEVDSVAITKFPTKTSYLYNSGEIDLSGIELTITYTDGTTETVTDVTKMSTNGFDDTKVGRQTVTVEYEGLTADFEAEVYVKAESMAITKLPAKTSYLYNSGEIDLSGIELTVTYTDGSTETVTDVTKMSTNGFDDTKVGTQTVTVEYEGLTADFEAEVYVKAESVAITKIPVKTSYTYKQGGIDLSGIELTVTYTDGTTETVTDTSKMTFSGFDNTKIGKQTVTVEYEGHTANFEVTVSYAWWQWIIRILLLGFLWY